MPKLITDNQILDAALDVIAQHGYAGATTQEIAAAAGINEVTLFRRFGNKQKLLAAAVEQEAEKVIAAGIEYTGDVQADLERIVRFYRELVQTRGRMIGMLISEIPRQPDLLEVMQTPLTIIHGMVALLERYQQEGVLIEEPPTQAFLALVGPIFMGGILRSVLMDVFAGPVAPAAHVERYLAGRRVGTRK